MADKKLRIIIEAVDKASKTLEGINKTVGKTAVDFKKLARNVGIAGVAIGTAVAFAGKIVLQEAGKFEQYELALRSMIGESEKADKLFKNLIAFAKETPFGFEEVVKGTKQLIAMGTTVENVIPELRMLGDVSAGLAVPMERLILNFGQVRAAGQLTGRELRDFTVAGVPLLATLADQFDTTTGAVKEMVTAGEIGFADVEQAFKTMTSEGGLFFDLMKVQSQTFLGQQEKLSDAVQQLKVALGDVLLPVAIDLVKVIEPLVERFTVWARENPKLVKTLFLIGAVLGVIGTAILLLLPIITLLTVAAGALNLAFLPFILTIGGIILAIGLLIAIGIFLITHWQELKAFADDVWFRISDRVLTTIAGIRKRITANLSLIKARWRSDWNLIKRITDDVLFRISDKVLTNIVGIKRTITANLNLIKAVFNTVLSAVRSKVSSWADAVKGFFDTVKGAVESLIGALKSLVSASSEAIGKVGGALGFQHGGVVPGAFNQPIPIIAHGGERVIPKTGTDVNPLAGGRGQGGGGVTINIEGDVNSTEMLERIIEAVKGALGRENELANQGLAT